MAKGMPILGKDPDGNAKFVNVDAEGNAKVTQVGNIASEPFSGNSDTIHEFETFMNGFVIANDGDTPLQFSTTQQGESLNIDFSDVSLWEDGSLSALEGLPQNTQNSLNTRIRTINFHDISPNLEVVASSVDLAATHEIIIMQYSASNEYLATSDWQSFPYTVTTSAQTAKIKLVLRLKNSDNIQPSDVFPANTLTIATENSDFYRFFEVKPGESFEADFDTFESVNVQATGEFRAYGRK